MLYLIEVSALVAAVVFGMSGVVILLLYAWFQLKEYYAEGRHRIQSRAAVFARQTPAFANPVAISRSSAREVSNAESRSGSPYWTFVTATPLQKAHSEGRSR
jgi:hypothetical protein